jgi:hypothetical protein
LFELAERDLEWFKQTQGLSHPGSAFFYEGTRASLERAKGHPDAAIVGFQKALTFVVDPGRNRESLGGQASSQLASALESVGRLPEAIAELQGADTDRVSVVILNALDRWLHGRAQLARLYRKNGQDEKAREVEAQLLKLLALADADYPLVKELRARN